ncbi:hypothetical protein JCGZ_11075 [Jatropha curcas]|uniref:Late embryogenesis abundant protein LEA-2 subgroup domain-containing protein n=1 Tax=Jatropha curcas TaxID=180498 RepID=A0A067KQE9_JATCU|nr:hypothetical protein JCGZ_11075 [Jatropha curcas]
MDKDQGTTTVIGYPVQSFSNSQLPPVTVAVPSTAAISTSNSDTTTTNNHSREKSIKRVEIALMVIVTCFAVIGFWHFIKFGNYEEEFHAPDFKVQFVTVYPFNISSPYVAANWDIIFLVKNIDDWDYNYQDMEASVLLKDKNISSAMVGNFSLEGGRNVERKILQANLAVSSAVMAEQNENGSLTFSFMLKCTGTKIEFKKTMKMIVLCENLKVKFISDDRGSLMDGPFKCKVNVYKMD